MEKIPHPQLTKLTDHFNNGKHEVLIHEFFLMKNK